MFLVRIGTIYTYVSFHVLTRWDRIKMYNCRLLLM
jgi:hypothetical protein